MYCLPLSHTAEHVAGTVSLIKHVPRKWAIIYVVLSVFDAPYEYCMIKCLQLQDLCSQSWSFTRKFLSK
ncbi:hypothetical protein XENTR_v10016207 [Xenopus tropicalis]|nr:hypothetical protein XENTR_v10016207 [Xenopus tropicalis]